MFHENQIVFLEDSFSSKNEVIHHLTHRENSAVRDADQYESDVLEREASFATYTIDGVAMPHARASDGVRRLAVSFVRLASPVAFAVRDDAAVDLLFAFATPDEKAHLDLLLDLWAIFSDAETLHRLRTCQTAEEARCLMERCAAARKE